MKQFSVGTPWGRMHVAFEQNGAMHMGGLKFGTKVRALHVTREARERLRCKLGVPFESLDPETHELRKVMRDLERAHLVNDHDLGSGAVTNVGCMALANEYAWGIVNSSNLSLSTLRLSNTHATGTGSTTTGGFATGLPIKLETPSTQGGQTRVAGTQTNQSAANTPKYRTLATISYTGSEAVTEWGLFGTSTLPSNTTLSDATGSPFTSGTATTGTVTATPLTASVQSGGSQVQGQQQSIFERTSGTNLSYGLVLSNTTSVITVPAWWLVASGAAGQAPANTETYVIRPVIWDRKVFSAVNVANLDAIRFTYDLTITSGG